MTEFAFKIGDYVALKAHVDLYDLGDVQPIVVNERWFQECEGGIQVSYTCRAIGPKGRCASFSAGTSEGGYFRLKESEIVALPEGYSEACKETSAWGSVGRTAKRLADEAAKLKPDT